MRPAWSTRALILLRLDARQGEWVDVADIAEHLGTSATALQAALLDLEQARLLSCLRQAADGSDHARGPVTQAIVPPLVARPL